MDSRPIRPRRQSRLANQQPSQDPPRAKWTTYLTKILADLMVEQILKGNRQNNSFSKKAWKYMCDEFHRKTDLKWDREQLKNRYGVLRRQHATMKSLLELSDFTWDETRRMVMAKDEAWDEYIKTHPDAETIRSNGCPIYKQLCIIFSEPGTNGNHDQLNHPVELDEEAPVLLTGQKTVVIPIDSRAQPMFVQDESSSSTEDDENIPNEQNKCQPMAPSSSVRKRNRSGIDDVMAKAILEMASASKLRVAAVSQSRGRFSITNCVKALDEMQGVDDHLYYAALDLFENPNARETFISLKIERRLVWLKGKCNDPTSSIA